MEVKIGDKIYNVENDGPIMIILTTQDKLNIANMAPHATKYCMYSDDYVKEEIEKFMKE